MREGDFGIVGARVFRVSIGVYAVLLGTGATILAATRLGRTVSPLALIGPVMAALSGLYLAVAQQRKNVVIALVLGVAAFFFVAMSALWPAFLVVPLAEFGVLKSGARRRGSRSG